jgi:hypothetical protein
MSRISVCVSNSVMGDYHVSANAIALFGLNLHGPTYIPYFIFTYVSV